MKSLTVLLLQAREPDDPMREHEHACFVARTGLDSAQITTHDLLSGAPSLSTVRRYDALLMGGSGDFLISQKNQPAFEPMMDLLREVTEVQHPTFAACYGFQAIVQALGGQVIYDPDNVEVGTFELELSDAAANDPLFGTLPSCFAAQQGHKDRAQRLPPQLVHLASSERAPFQAVRVEGAPMWAVQFHPELDRDANRARYRHYLEHYAPGLSEAELAEALAGFAPSPAASALLRRFFEVVFR